MTVATTIEEEETSKASSSSRKLLRIRRYLLILLAIQAAVCIIIFLVQVYSQFVENDQDSLWEKIEFLLWIFALVLYYLCGILFVYKSYRLGIRLFAFIGVFLFTIICLFVSYIFLIIAVLGVDYNIILGVQVFLAFALIFGVFAGIVIATLKLAFNLAKLIKTNGYAMV